MGGRQEAFPHSEDSMDLAQIIAISMGVAWASGINMYAAIAMLGILGATGHMVLPAGLEPLTDPMVIMAASFMYCVEFFADKVPGVDTGWDAIHTFAGGDGHGRREPARTDRRGPGGRYAHRSHPRHQGRCTGDDQHLP
jgi:hypothetical protein